MKRFIGKREDRLLSQRFKDRVWRKADEYVAWKMKNERQGAAHECSTFFFVGLVVGIMFGLLIAGSVT